MVLHLADRLEVPLRDRNRLLLAAGYAPVFPERTLADERAGERLALEDGGTAVRFGAGPHEIVTLTVIPSG